MGDSRRVFTFFRNVFYKTVTAAYSKASHRNQIKHKRSHSQRALSLKHNLALSRVHMRFVFRHLSTAFDIFVFGHFRASFFPNPKGFSHRSTHV